MPFTLFDRIWDAHVVATRDDGRDLLYCDRHVVHDLHGPTAFRKLQKAGRKVRRPDLTFGVIDHSAGSRPGRTDETKPNGARHIIGMREETKKLGVRLFDLDDPEQGISHVIAPELGVVLPGSTYVCPDSHACTVGALGALAFGLGTTDLEHVLATQTIALRRPKSYRIEITGKLAAGLSSKDVALALLADLGVSACRGFVVQYCGSVVDEFDVEGRLTLCNLAVEMGAPTALIAPDEKTIAWLSGRPYLPTGNNYELALTQWRDLAVADPRAIYDAELTFDVTGLEPQISWGTNPGQTIPISGTIPDPKDADPEERDRIVRALSYMALEAGTKIEGLPIDRVFIGSCTNARLSDLSRAAEIVQGEHVAEGVLALVVPGSTTVKRQAEALGLDRVFIDAGFVWGEAGCSLCGGSSEYKPEPGKRTLSTTNRNFENRQGAGVRTHLASPEMAAAGAITGVIVDVREFLRESV